LWLTSHLNMTDKILYGIIEKMFGHRGGANFMRQMEIQPSEICALIYANNSIELIQHLAELLIVCIMEETYHSSVNLADGKDNNLEDVMEILQYILQYYQIDKQKLINIKNKYIMTYSKIIDMQIADSIKYLNEQIRKKENDKFRFIDVINQINL